MIVTVKGNETTLVTWLRAQRDHMMAFKQVQPVLDCPGLRVTPDSHQWKAVAHIESNNKSIFEGVLLGHPPGFGKTLPATMAIVRAISAEVPFSIVVVPTTLVDQWKREFTKYFKEGTIKVFILRDQATTRSQLLAYDVVVTSYDVVVTSYDMVVSQHQRLVDYENDLQRFNAGPKPAQDKEERPSRPDLSLFNDPLDSVKSPYLVLDDAHKVRDLDSVTFRAMSSLRERSHGCVMLTGSMLEDDWMDTYAYSSFLRGHPFSDIEVYKNAFSIADPNDPSQRIPPENKYMDRFTLWLKCFTITCPPKTLARPSMDEDTIPVEVGKHELQASNAAFNAGDELRSDLLLHHPRQLDIMQLNRAEAMAASNQADVTNGTSHSPEQRDMYQKWLRALRQDGNWKSPRVIEVSNVLYISAMKHACRKIVVMSDFVYFLDILEISFQESNAPLQVVRLDGRTPPAQRQGIIDQFSDTPLPAVLLTTRAAGGSGLNLQVANVLIMCNVFEFEKQTEQAIGQLWRRGQTRPVYAFTMKSHGPCTIERMECLVLNEVVE